MPTEEVNVRETLVKFWLDELKSNSNDVTDRIKVSEMLAKYVLREGQGMVKIPRSEQQAARPSTREVLRLAAEMDLDAE